MHLRLSPGDRNIVERLIARESPTPSEVILILHEVEESRIRSLGACSIQKTREQIAMSEKHARFGLHSEALRAVLASQLTALLEDERDGANITRVLFRHCWQLAACSSHVIGLRCPEPDPDAMSAMVLQLHPQFECDVLHVSIVRRGGHGSNAFCFEHEIKRPSPHSAVVIPFLKPKGA